MTAPAWAVVGAMLAAFISGAFGIVNATKANKPAESNAQLAWVKSAQDEASAARSEAREAKTEASAARLESEETRRQSVQIRREFDGIQDWVDRVVRAADAYRQDLADRGQNIEDSGVIRLLKAINGGPHIEAK